MEVECLSQLRNLSLAVRPAPGIDFYPSTLEVRNGFRKLFLD